jgi:hypothetical protein
MNAVTFNLHMTLLQWPVDTSGLELFHLATVYVAAFGDVSSLTFYMLKIMNFIPAVICR